MPSDDLKSLSKFSVPHPKSSSEDSGTPANNMLSAAKSFRWRDGGNVTAGIQEPSQERVVRALNPMEIKLLMEQGERFIAAGAIDVQLHPQRFPELHPLLDHQRAELAHRIVDRRNSGAGAVHMELLASVRREAS
jgi:hypothetical protein